MQAQQSSQKRYLNQDGTINWVFIKQYNPRHCTDGERRVRHAFNLFNGYHNVKVLLAEWGEYTITDEDLAQQECARRTSEILRREREECYRRHSAWGRGRKTATATV